jgi:hypothetical protein
MALMNIADQGMQRGWAMVNADRTHSFPYFDMKLNTHGADFEIELVRGKIIPHYDHRQIINACWNTMLDFRCEVVGTLKRYVEIEVREA